MNALPDSWTYSTLGQVCDSGQYGWTTSAAAQGAVRLLRTTDITKRSVDWASVPYCIEVPNDLSRYLINANDIVVSRAGSVGFSKLLPEVPSPTVFASYLIRFKPTIAVEPRYVAAYLRSPRYWRDIGNAQAGIALANVNATKLAALPLPLAPLREQQRIADKLDTVLARVDACRDRLARIGLLLKRFRQSVLAAATSGRLTEDWRRSASTRQGQGNGNDLLDDIQASKRQWLKSLPHHNEATRVKRRVNAFRPLTTTQDRLPATWASACLEDVVLMVVDCHNKTAPYEKQGIALVRTTNVRDGRFAWEDLRFVSEATYAFWSRRCPPESGDLVFTREAPMGEVAIIPENTRICLGQRTMLIRPIEALLPAKFLQICLMDPRFRERSERIAVGSGVKHYRVGDVSELVLPIPPAAEQGEIVRRVEILFAFADRLESRLNQAQTAVDRLTPSLLAKAFRGELVPQDPADEPAAELLKRLAAQRAAAPSRARRARRSEPA